MSSEDCKAKTYEEAAVVEQHYAQAKAYPQQQQQQKQQQQQQQQQQQPNNVGVF